MYLSCYYLYHINVGITFPSVSQQIKLFRNIFHSNSLNTKDVRYIEAHGTGTVAGDGFALSSTATVFTSYSSSSSSGNDGGDSNESKDPIIPNSTNTMEPVLIGR